jgi:microcompartment protein CcmL/EutN
MNQGNAVGIIELSSIYKGFAVQDAVLKSTRVSKLLGRTICSGKYLIMVRGEVSDIEACLALASEEGDFAIVSNTIITNVDERVFPAISGSVEFNPAEADGAVIIETFTVAAAIKAADHALKAAEVKLVRVQCAMAIGGKGYVVLVGNIDALKSALEPAIEYAGDEGALAGYTLITQPHPDLLSDLV